MDITTTIATTAVKSPEPDTQNPTRAQPTPFTNGVLKRRAPLHLHHHHHGHPVVVTYKECLKNHAASIGGHAVDGCGEFMPSPSLNPSDPTSLKCAACGCHRNFHRRDPEVTAAQPPPPALEYQPHHRHLPPPPRVSPSNQDSPSDSPSPPPISSTYPHHMMLPLGNQQGTHHHHSAAAAAASQLIPSSTLSNSTRKRFRTKFTQDQKQKMLEFAERVAWRMQKRDEDIINQFCNEIGVEKGVFKVWMHNNKNTSSAKKDQQISGNNNGDHNSSHGNNGEDNYGDDEMGHQIHLQNLSHHQQQITTHGHEDNSTGTSGNNGHDGVATNASNSSSS